MKILAKVFIFLQFTGQIFAQDIQFSQIFSDILYLNPAYAGSKYCPRAVLAYRNQWSGIRNPYSTYSASFDKYSPVLNGGFGLRFMNDKQGGGIFNQTSADVIYSFHTQLTRKVAVKFAMQTSIVQKSINPKNLVFSNMIDPLSGIVYNSTESFEQRQFATPDFTVAMLINTKNYFMGFVASHIPHSLVDEHDKYLPVKYLAHAGGTIKFDKYDRKRSKFAIKPNIVYINQQNINMLYYGLFFDVNKISLGSFCRQNIDLHFDALVLSLHLNLDKLSISYSYDVTLSSFLGRTLGSHELSISYLFPCDKKIKPYNAISCPSL